MTKGKNANRKSAERDKKLNSTQNIGPSKRGRKSNKQILENLSNIYEANTPEQIRKTIHGWEKQSEDEDEDIQEQQAKFDFIFDPGSTRGRVSLFQQTVKTYWKIKCVLARAMMSMQEKELNSSVLFELQQIKQDMREMSKAQLQQNARIGRIEQQLLTIQQAEMPGSTAKDPAPIDSSDG